MSKSNDKSITLYPHQIAALKAGKPVHQVMTVLSDAQIAAGFQWTHEANGDSAIFDQTTRYGDHNTATIDCPYGKEGDYLWVAEVHRPIAWRFDDGEVLIEYRDGIKAWCNYLTDDELENNPNDDYLIEILKELDDRNVPKYKDRNGNDAYDLSDPVHLPKWRLASDMPKFASRLKDALRISGMCIERVNDTYKYIFRGQWRAEPSRVSIGIKPDNQAINYLDYPLHSKFFRVGADEFVTHWDLVHGMGAWDRNDWVWLVELAWSEL